MTTRRGSKYSIQSDGAGLRSRFDPSKGKRKGKIPSRTYSTQGSAICQRQVPEMPIISEKDLEISMSNSNRYKVHSEGSNRHLYELVKEILHCVQGQELGNVSTNPPRSDERLTHLEKIPQREGNIDILQWMESTIIKTSNQQDEGVPCQKEEGQKGRSPCSFCQKSSSQPTSPRREEEMEETIFPKLQDSKNPKRCHGKCFQHGQSLDGIQGQRGTKNETTLFPKEITFSPEFLYTLTEFKN
ncbi:hypothetical protein O181_122777 [Austropuccinia psidii MF-1]|uniref:Uncharacterized protein n=1 Tax=Austropuccinia psidii MF-1 TaxID=1389203 RepID=A0A9Q3KLI1_9BASI|nr:hypothetical protein [Austropuccinia psidii MF-1]